MAKFEKVSCVEAVERVLTKVFSVSSEHMILKAEYVDPLRLIFGDQEVLESINYLVDQKKIDMPKIEDLNYFYWD
jgi:hypothetical protein